MKSVLISIKPKWCELIANGKKTIELRKTRPKLETPFKCYIYQTRKPVSFYNNERIGKVIGEFVCDRIFPIMVEYSDPSSRIALREFPYTGLTDKQIIDYLGNGNQGYGWHVSDLVIYDKPRELSEFRVLRKTKYGSGMDYVAIKRPPQSWCYVEGESRDEQM